MVYYNTSDLVVDVNATNTQVNSFFDFTNYTEHKEHHWLNDLNITLDNSTYNVTKDTEGPLYFSPENCAKNSSFAIPRVASPYIGVIGKEINQTSVANNTVNYMKAIFKWQDENLNEKWHKDRPRFTFKYFDTEEDL